MARTKTKDGLPERLFFHGDKGKRDDVAPVLVRMNFEDEHWLHLARAPGDKSVPDIFRRCIKEAALQRAGSDIYVRITMEKLPLFPRELMATLVVPAHLAASRAQLYEMKGFTVYIDPVERPDPTLPEGVEHRDVMGELQQLRLLVTDLATKLCSLQERLAPGVTEHTPEEAG